MKFSRSDSRCRGSNPAAPTGQSVSNAFGIGCRLADARREAFGSPVRGSEEKSPAAKQGLQSSAALVCLRVVDDHGGAVSLNYLNEQFCQTPVANERTLRSKAVSILYPRRNPHMMKTINRKGAQCDRVATPVLRTALAGRCWSVWRR